jgi:hypothetical protein
LVPVLNQIVAKGLETKFSCADRQIMIAGASVDAMRLLEPIQACLGEAYLEWRVLNETLVTELSWHARDRVTNDEALMKAAEKIAELAPAPKVATTVEEVAEGMSTTLKMSQAGEIVSRAHARIMAYVYARARGRIEHAYSPTIILSQTQTGYLLHIGYALEGDDPTKIEAASLGEVAEQFELAFPRPEEAVELS